jgi:hypothetical protein
MLRPPCLDTRFRGYDGPFSLHSADSKWGRLHGMTKAVRHIFPPPRTLGSTKGIKPLERLEPL